MIRIFILHKIFFCDNILSSIFKYTSHNVVNHNTLFKTHQICKSFEFSLALYYYFREPFPKATETNKWNTRRKANECIYNMIPCLHACILFIFLHAFQKKRFRKILWEISRRIYFHGMGAVFNFLLFKICMQRDKCNYF